MHINISLSTIVLACVNKLTGYNPLSIQINLLSHLRNRGQWVGGRWSLSINSRNRLCMILVRVLFVVTSLRFFFVPIFAKCITNVHYVKVHYDGVWKLTFVCSLHCVTVTIFSVQLSAQHDHSKECSLCKGCFSLQCDLNACIGVDHNCNYEQLYIKATQWVCWCIIFLHNKTLSLF